MNKFQVKCLNCNSTDISIIEDGDYMRLYNDDCESWEILGYHLKCNNCGTIENVEED